VSFGRRSAGGAKEPPTRSALDTALSHLARREYSERELRQKLLGLGHETEAVDAALQRVLEDGYLSDQRYAAVATRSLISRGKGPRALKQKLGSAGIDAETAQAALPADIDWLAQAREVLQRRFGEAPAADAKEWGRRARFLLSRGYNESQVRAAVGPQPREKR
jgi:regulatory protein